MRKVGRKKGGKLDGSKKQFVERKEREREKKESGIETEKEGKVEGS